MSLHAQDRGVEEHVLATRQLGMEPGAQLDQRGQLSVDIDLTFRWFSNLGENLEKGALAGTIRPNDTNRLTSLDFERHTFERPVLPGIKSISNFQIDLLIVGIAICRL